MILRRRLKKIPGTANICCSKLDRKRDSRMKLAKLGRRSFLLYSLLVKGGNGLLWKGLFAMKSGSSEYIAKVYISITLRENFM